MRKERTLLILGVWVAILSFLGFPDTWRSTLYLLTGFALIYLSYIFYQEARARIPKNGTLSKTFTDNITDNN